MIPASHDPDFDLAEGSLQMAVSLSIDSNNPVKSRNHKYNVIRRNISFHHGTRTDTFCYPGRYPMNWRRRDNELYLVEVSNQHLSIDEVVINIRDNT